MSKKITILGTGNVGATVAYTLTQDSLASEIVLIDINRAKAEGEAMDIIHGAPFSTPLNIYAGDYSDASGSDMVIITSGIGRKPGQSRLELASINTKLMADKDYASAQNERACAIEQQISTSCTAIYNTVMEGMI